MKPSLGIFFSVLLTTGASLECETCSNIGNNCSGHLQACSADQDICAITLSEISLGIKVRTTVKSCDYSHFCQRGPTSMHLGLERTIITTGVCCIEADCRDVSLKLPAKKAIFNGKRCPACYSVSNKCPQGMVDCVGTEDYCFSLVFYSAKDLWNTSMNGCTTKTSCAGLTRKNIVLGGFEVNVLKVACKPASKSPPSSEYPFLALFGLLLKKLF